MSPLSKKRGHHDLRILRFERTASTAAVRTHGDFGIIPNPYAVDGERKTIMSINVKISEQKTSKCELNCALRKESFASRCETLLLLG